MTTIEHQKQVADKVLEQLYLICPEAIVAGGAPRDWYLGKPANDIDVYFSSTTTTASKLIKQLEKCFDGMQIKFEQQMGKNINPLYQTMEGLVRIIEFVLDGVKVQLIQMDTTKRLYSVVGNMSVSVCKVWYTNGKIAPTRDFLITLKSGVMFLSPKYNWNDPHPTKMAEMFKDKFTCGTQDIAKERIITMSLREGE